MMLKGLMKMNKKYLSLILAAILVVGLVPTASVKATTSPYMSGYDYGKW
jgi:hypothetical protein